ncbi:MAG: hypothetical protein KBE23_06590 [Chloroflexi bacterium]|nr:hypothetical protein [Chloroflexota bacterium]MBP7042393.1 hypothetical protein [Chloroflexota bacterium]
MDPNEPRLPAPEDGRSPADLTKKELVAHLVAAEAIPQWKLNVMTRDAIVALFDMPRDGALAAIDAAGLAHGRKHRRPKPAAQEETAVYEHFLTGRVKR